MGQSYIKGKLLDLCNENEDKGIDNLIIVKPEEGDMFESVCQSYRHKGSMTDRKLTVCNGRGNYRKAPPQILLQGKWLEQAGFSAGDKVRVTKSL